MSIEFYFDMDGVLCDWKGAVFREIQRFNLPVPEVVDYHFFKDDMYGGVRKLIETEPAFWEGLDEHPGGMNAFRLVQDQAFILSDPGGYHAAGTGKLKWLHARNVNRQRIILTPQKAKLAKPGRVLIDDRASLCNEFVAEGGEAILVVQPWTFNEGCTGMSNPKITCTNLDSLQAVVETKLKMASINPSQKLNFNLKDIVINEPSIPQVWPQRIGSGNKPFLADVSYKDQYFLGSTNTCGS